MGLLKSFAVWGLLFLLCSARLEGQTPRAYRFNHLTVNENLSHTDADDVVQDRNGFIWIATLFGLDRFDGYHIKRFYNRNEPFRNAFKNRIQSLALDSAGGIWLGTEGGLQYFDRKTERYIDYRFLGGPPPTPMSRIIKSRFLYILDGSKVHCYAVRDSLLEEQFLDQPAGVTFTDMHSLRSGVMVLSSNKGLWTLSGDRVLRPLPGLSGYSFNGFSADPGGRLLLSSGNRLLLVSLDGCTVLHVFVGPPGEDLGRAVSDNKGEYWVSTNRRLIRLDSTLHAIQTIEASGTPAGLHASVITDLFIDRSQCLWVCTFGHGVNYCDLNEKLFFTLQPQDGLSGNIVKSILDEKGETLWIGTNKGLNQFNYRTGKYRFHGEFVNVSALMTDRAGNLWIGDRDGLSALGRDRVTRLQVPGDFPKHSVETLAEDCYGNIWFGNHNDAFGVIVHGSRVKLYGEEGFFIVADDRQPYIMVSGTNGLKRSLVDRDGNILWTDTIRARPSGPSLSSDYTYPVRKIDDSSYWVGTIGGGLDRLCVDDRRHTFSVKTYGEDVGVFPDVESIEVDNSGKVWMGGNGLLCLDPSTGHVVRYDKNDGLQDNSFKVNASCKAADGRLFFGGINGLNYFNPVDIQANPVAARPALTGMLINNKPVVYGDSVLTLGFVHALRLNHLQNNFVLSFSAMHFAGPLKCRYRYMLTGYDRDWNYTDGLNPTAAYSNLDYGGYTFIVEATNNDGVWSPASVRLPILLTPPWWKSIPAKIAYALLVIGLLAGIYIYQGRWYRLKRKLAIEHRREEMHRQQLDFFANISHELRTPLTLISGPLEGLMKDDTAHQATFQMMFRNVKRLTNLLNELMNFKKVADGAVRLHVEEISLRGVCENLYHDFRDLADQKSIDFSFAGHGDFTNYFDRQIVEKILINLLYNAFKFTEAGGFVQLEIVGDIRQFAPAFAHGYRLDNTGYSADAYVYLLIRDSGVGIAQESIRNIFDRYYRVSNEQMGSGVGLALVRSLTLLHKGVIALYSEPGKGTEILVGLPWGGANYSAAERAAPGFSQPGLEPIVLVGSTGGSEAGHSATGLSATGLSAGLPSAKSVLIVEDNAELCGFLSETLGNSYQIFTAGDGNAGWKAAMENLPDLIISDVMMPGMDGIELCRQVKTTFATSHIPFLILSARDAVESRIAGLESGADYYIAKPVSIELLLLTVRNIFDHRDRLRARYAKDYLTQATELVHTTQDKAFIQQLLALIEANLQEPDLDIDFLCGKLLTSRTQLYLKIKSITGQSTGEFIKTVRLKKAIHIMTHEDVPLSTVAERIGLQSASYFSRVFRKEFGKSPTEFMQEVKGA